MKSLSLGMKISLGFAALIIIACALGLMSIVEMGGVEVQSNMLAHEYVPEMQVAGEIRDSVRLVMYAVRAYGYTGEEKHYQDAQKEMAAVETALDKAGKLEAASPNLKALKGQLEKASKAFNDYKAVTQQTKDTIAKMAEERKVMAGFADNYLQNCNNFLANQNEAFKKEANSNDDASKKEAILLERLNKINVVNDIINLGNTARVGNFESQAMRSPEIMKQAMQVFPKIEEKLSELQKTTRQPANLKQIEEIRKSGNAYKQDMSDFLEIWLENEAVADKRREIGTQMIAVVKETADSGAEAAERIAEETVSSLS